MAEGRERSGTYGKTATIFLQDLLLFNKPVHVYNFTLNTRHVLFIYYIVLGVEPF